MDGEKSGERDCEGNARVGVVRKKEKEMETGEVGFLFLLHGMGGGGIERTRMRTGMRWPLKPEWRLWAGGRLWGWYRKICGGMCWPAGAGMELTGCRRMFDVTVLPAGLAERQNLVLRCSPGCEPGGGVCGARSPA